MAKRKEPPEQAQTRFAKDQLKAFVERIERLEEEKKSLADDIRDVYAEAKGNGYDVKCIREIVKLRKQDKDERSEHEAVLDTYKQALGMLFDLPLGRAATERATTAAKPTGAQASAALAQAMADDGLISQESATETARIADAVDKLEARTVARIAANPKVRAAFKKLGTPDEEKARGGTAAFIGKDGTRMSISMGKPRQVDLEEAIAEKQTGTG